ncbi:unnamed protein product [Coccothraustes coccothraustes]
MSALISAGRASHRRGDKGEESLLRGRCFRRVVCSQRSEDEENGGRRSPSPSRSPDEAGSSTAPRVSRRRRGGPILRGGKGWKGCRGAEQLGVERGLPQPRRLLAASGTRGGNRAPSSLERTLLLLLPALGGFTFIGDAPRPRLSWSCR